jgi:DNA-binding beta-propeller fold protein YncE
MHPDIEQLAAYLDGALDEAAQTVTRAHILTCPTCVARLERLRADARRITMIAAGPAPDLRAAVRARLRRPSLSNWLLRGAALAGALAALFLFALLIGVSSGTVGRLPDRLFVVDQGAGQLIELDAASGKTLGSIAVGDQPSEVLYDRRLDRLYVRLPHGVAAVDSRALTLAGRWAAEPSFGTSAGMALDEARGRLYLSWPDAGVISALGAATLMPIQLAPDRGISFPAGPAPGALLLAPDGKRLFTADSEDGQIWTIDLSDARITASGSLLDRADVRAQRWLALGPDGQTLYVLRAGVRPLLRQVDLRSGKVSGSVLLDNGPQPWDLLLIDTTHLAIPRGDGRIGGVTIVSTDNLSVTARLDPDHDQHHLAAGPGGSFFGLNWLHATVALYDPARTPVIAWQAVPRDGGRPWDGVYIGGGWRWPW